jgi:hypothetical protein
MAEQEEKGELLVVTFDYKGLDAQVAENLQSAAERIRQKIQRTLEDIVEIGNDLRVVKESLGHGQFGKWLKAEFGWGERMARNFMSVAERFGKSATIADLEIPPTAAYLLAAPSVPDEARQAAIERAKGGEQITTAVAREIVAEVRKEAAKKKKGPRKGTVTTKQLGDRLAGVLQRYRDRWEHKELSELARQLREFADGLEKPARGGGKRKNR